MYRPPAKSQRGQTLVIFTLLLPVLLLAAGLVADTGYGLSQQRAGQNAADFSAMAGARVLGESYTGKPVGAGTDANVVAAVNSVLSANHAQLVSAKYVDQTGKALGDVGGGIPANAVGVTVNAKTSWKTFFLGIMGVNTWSAGVAATAVVQSKAAAGVMPIGIDETAFRNLPYCDPMAANFASCLGSSSGDASAKIAPGAFGWLAFGAPSKGSSKCNGFGLGMIDGGCDVSQSFLDSEVGPPPNSYGCCTTLDPTAANNFIGSATGNMPADFSAYVNQTPPVIVWVPIYDEILGTGAGAYYHIVGFGSIVLVGYDTQHGKWIQAVRVSASFGPTPNGVLIDATGAVNLVH